MFADQLARVGATLVRQRVDQGYLAHVAGRQRQGTHGGKLEQGFARERLKELAEFRDGHMRRLELGELATLYDESPIVWPL